VGDAEERGPPEDRGIDPMATILARGRDVWKL